MTHPKLDERSDGTHRQTSPTSQPTSHNASISPAQSTLVDVIDGRGATSHKATKRSSGARTSTRYPLRNLSRVFKERSCCQLGLQPPCRRTPIVCRRLGSAGKQSQTVYGARSCCLQVHRKTLPERGFCAIGETGFEPATARPPVGSDGLRPRGDPLVHWVFRGRVVLSFAQIGAPMVPSADRVGQAALRGGHHDLSSRRDHRLRPLVARHHADRRRSPRCKHARAGAGRALDREPPAEAR
jgi:hypothetical protein